MFWDDLRPDTVGWEKLGGVCGSRGVPVISLQTTQKGGSPGFRGCGAELVHRSADQTPSPNAVMELLPPCPLPAPLQACGPTVNSVLTHVTGAAPDRKFVIQWTAMNVQDEADKDKLGTFQVRGRGGGGAGPSKDRAHHPGGRRNRTSWGRSRWGAKQEIGRATRGQLN